MKRRATSAIYGSALVAAAASILAVAVALTYRAEERFALLGAIAAALMSSIASGFSWRSSISLKRLSERGQVFVSYNLRDEKEAKQVSAMIRHAGFLPWMASERIAAGDNWMESVASALQNSAAVLVVVTDHSGDISQSMRTELRTAVETSFTRDSSQSPVIPALFGDATLPSDLRGLQSIRMDVGEGASNLTAALNRVFLRKSRG